MDKQNEPDSDLPKKLTEGLRGLGKDRVFVPRDVDEAVLAKVRDEFGHKQATADQGEPLATDVVLRRKRTVLIKSHRAGKWQKWLPLAASITIAGIIIYFSHSKDQLASDLNRDGNVDVIDAFVLAERMRAGGEGVDVNGDGSADAADAEAITKRAVELEEGS